MRKPRRYFAVVGAGVFVAFFLTTLLLAATGPGQRILLRMAAWATSSNDLAVKITGLDGSLFSEGRIASLSLSDADGTWAEMNDIRFAWSPWSLLGGAVDVESVSIGKATIIRTPNAAAGSANRNHGGDRGGGLAIPPLRLGGLTIDEAILGKALLGEAARLSVSAQLLANDPSKAVAGAITVSDLDRPSVIKAHINYRAQTGSLKISAEADEKAGGVVSTLLDMGDGADLRLALDGGGPINAWRGDWSFASGGKRQAGGTLTLDREHGGLRIATEAKGEIARLLPPPFAEILAGNADLQIQARILSDQSYRLERLQLVAPRIKATASGTINITDRRIEGGADIRLLDNKSEPPIALKIGESGTIELREARAVFSAKPDQDGVALFGTVDASHLTVDGNRAEHVSLRLSARQPNNVARLLEKLDVIILSGAVQNPQFADPAIQLVVGEQIRLDLQASKAGKQLAIAEARLSASAGTVNAKGAFDANGFAGEIGITVPDAKVLSRLARRDLSGVLTATAKGKAGFDGTLNLSLNGQGQHMTAGADLVAQLLEGASTLGGTLARDESGMVRFGGLALRTHALSLDLDGSLSPEASNLKLKGQIAELARVLPNSSGVLSFEAAIDGKGNARDLSARLSATEAVVRGKPLRDLVIGFRGRGGFETQQGVFSAHGQIGDAPLTGTGQLAFSQAEGPSVRGFKLALGDNRIEADGALPATGEARGTAHVHIVEAAQLAPLLGAPLDGDATIDAQLSGSADAPQLTIRAASDHLSYDTIKLGNLSAAFDISDALERPTISGAAQIKTLFAGESRVADLKLAAKPDADRSAFDLSARVDDRWQIAGKVLLVLPNWRPDAELHHISIRSGSAMLSQEGTAQLSIADTSFRLRGLVFTAGKGRIIADVAMAETLGGKIDIKQFPASFVAPFAPDMQPRGTLDGTIDLAGKASAPSIAYKLSWRDAFLAGPLPPGFPSLDLSAFGTLQGDTLKIDARAAGPDGVNLKANGSVSAISAAPKLDLKATGVVPLGLASVFLAARGTRLDGHANVDLSITGKAIKPVIDGRVTASGASIKDAPTGINLHDASLTAHLSDGALRIETLAARSEKGGNLTATGSVGVLESPTLPVDLKIKAEALHFDDQRVAKADVAGDLALKGNLNGRSELSGSVDIARLDIQIPQSLPASVEALELKHKNAPAYIAAAQPAAQSETISNLPSTIGLSLAIRSANRIFVSGRGLDAQLGGELQLLGSADKPRGIGEFTLERGRLVLLGRTLDFASGSVNFSGDLDPVLNFLATTDVDGTKIEVRVSGQASDPKFSFTSSPELPEDEILALLLFNKSLGELSPLQIAQLASEVSDLGGLSGGPGILGWLKSGVGIDTLNLTTDKHGETSVSAGSYLNERIFVGVEQGLANDSSSVKIDLDITKNLKLRGQTDAEGQSKLGIGVEWEY